MSPSFERLMSQAMKLTQSGKLKEATAAIQAALSGRPAAPAATPSQDDTMVIDVEAREVDMEAEPATAPPEVQKAHDAAVARPATPAEGRFMAGSHTDKAGSREYKLYVPAGHEGRAVPMVVMLHGCTQNPDDFAAGTRMNEAAAERGWFVLYPAQAQAANPQRCWNWFKHNHQERGRGEPAILAGMVLDVIERYGIDPRRVYVAGLSAGGAMAAILGDTYPDVFAAVGVHSGLPTGAAKDLASAFAAMNGSAPANVPGVAKPPTIVFHGDQDGTVHPVNGERAVARPAGANAPASERERSSNGHEYTLHTYRDAGGQVVAEHWVVHGSGHAWSGGSAAGSYTDAKGPDATAAMLRFFEAHTLAAVAGR